MDNHNVTAILGYRDTHQEMLLDNDYSANDLLRSSLVDDFKQFSEEIRIGSPNTSRVRYTAGLYHLNETANSDHKATIGSDAGTTLVNHPLISFPFYRSGRLATIMMLFMILNYSLSGVVASIGLAIYTTVTVALIYLFEIS